MPAAVIWLMCAVGLAGAEALTGDMFLVMLSGGALTAAATSAVTHWPQWADGVVFLVVSVLLAVLVRPVLLQRLRPPLDGETGVPALVGRTALVLDQIGRQGGTVNLGGEVWTARPLTDGDVFEPGEQVMVMHIDGATAVVGPAL